MLASVAAITAGSGTQLCACLRSVFPLSFIIDVEKCLVFHDRPAQRTAELVVVERILGSGS